MQTGKLYTNCILIPNVKYEDFEVRAKNRRFSWAREENVAPAVSSHFTNNHLFRWLCIDLQETMVQRILKRAEESEVKRADDNEATIRTRIETFVKNTDEILVQYPSQTRRVSTTQSAFAKFKP